MTEKAERQFKVRRRYFVSPHITFKWLEQVVSKTKSLYGPITYFNGSFELQTDYRDNVSLEHLKDWVEYARQHWSEIASSSAWILSDNRQIDFYCNHTSSSIDLSVNGLSIEECNKTLATLEQDSQLAPVKEEKAQHAVRMRFFTHLSLRQWFEGFVNYMKSSWEPITSFDGSYDLRSYFYGDKIRLETFSEWVEHIQQNWADLAESGAYFYGDSRNLSFGCDHRRSLINLEVSSNSIELSNNILAKMQEHLSLFQVQEDPYRYRKSAATYKVGDWSKKGFVDATRLLIKEIFGEQEPAIDDAFVTKVLDNNIERAQGFHDINEYLNFIEESDESAFEWANLGMEGSAGIAIGISFSKKDKKLELRSNIPPNELEEKITKYYKEPLQLKLTKGEVTGSAISSTTQPKTEKWWVKYVFEIIVTVIGAAVVIVSLARAYFTEYSLVVTNPIESPAEVNQPEISLDWYLWPKDSLFHEADYQTPASILIIYQNKTVSKFDNAIPTFPVQLEKGEGKYIIEVRPQSKAQPVRMIVTYESEHKDTENDGEGVSP